jgi:bifunctional ADP-heptose synthase (sugar kinase/adenylyltransferase)
LAAQRPRSRQSGRAPRILRKAHVRADQPRNASPLSDLARLGATFPLSGLGLVGDDSEGEWIRSEFASHGIDHAQIRSHPTAPTSYTDLMSVQSTVRRTFFHQRGANAFLGPE